KAERVLGAGRAGEHLAGGARQHRVVERRQIAAEQLLRFGQGRDLPGAAWDDLRGNAGGDDWCPLDLDGQSWGAVDRCDGGQETTVLVDGEVAVSVDDGARHGGGVLPQAQRVDRNPLTGRGELEG